MYSTNLLLCVNVCFYLIFKPWQLLEHFNVPFCHVQLTYYSMFIVAVLMNKINDDDDDELFSLRY